jgi:hypothetical protein
LILSMNTSPRYLFYPGEAHTYMDLNREMEINSPWLFMPWFLSYIT